MSVATGGRRVRTFHGWSTALLVVAVMVLGSAGQSGAAPGDRSADGAWTQVDPGRTLSVQQAAVLPEEFSLFSINGQSLNSVLARAPREFTGGPEVILTLPMPDGAFARFRIEESPILSPEMQAENPDIRTFVGQGIDDPTATVRFDITMFGFRAQVLSPGGTILVDPVVRGQTGTVMSFFKRDYPQPEEPFECAVPITGEEDYRGVPQSAAWGETLRTYRLAVTATGEYTNQFGGVVGADAQITTTVNRVTGIYERDLAIRLNLVATNLFTDSTTDPFDTTASDALLDANRTVCNDSVGLANYDIGHLFGASAGGGKGDIGSVCTANKARGATLRSNPTGDPFDVDYVAHEIGHQFGGNHTFNGSTSNCGGGARTDHSAYEPGSGTTIMAYAGICGAENIQANSDPYFHARSLDQILTFREGTGNCGAPTATGNTPPTAAAGADFTIPRGTPFWLDGNGNDANGDAITYCWEQYNLGPASPPTSMASGPIFRSRPPTTSDFRYFPQLSDWVNNAATPWEQLPTVDRVLTFRLTVRDNRANGGGVAWEDVNVTVAGDPFFVMYPNGGENLSAGCPVTVTWTVGGGSVAANAALWLSTDGGLTQSHFLGTTANDGSAEVTLPCVNTTQARVFVIGAGRNFFDCSNTNFTISSNKPTIAGSAVGGAVDASCARLVTFSATVDDDCSVSAADVNVAASVVSSAASLGQINVVESQTSSDQVGLTGSVNVFGLTQSPATVRITVTAKDGCGNTESRVLETTVVDQTPPTITCPVDLTFECDDISSFGTPSSTDNCDASPDLTIAQRDSVPGDCPQEYTLTLTHQAMDFAGNTASCQQVIQVIDTTPPVLTCYDTLGFVFTSPTEANVYWDASAVDNCAPTPTVACVPPSGTLFGIGEHSVNCSADDGCGNTSACSFKFRLVPLDVHPTSCPNPINLKASGGPMALLPVALLGTADFAVADVNLETLRLNGVAPVQRRFEDISTPVANDPSTGCECTTAGRDGRMDLTLRFVLEDITATLPAGSLVDGATVMLQITGEMKDGTPIAGGDCGTIRTKSKTLAATDSETSGISELAAWNSPNPFNPTTMISYRLPQAGHVRLTVYNLLGQEVSTLVDQWQEVGEYAVYWSGYGSASGVYFYRVETAAGELRKKMLLLK